MSKVTIRIPTPLRSYTGGADEVTVEGSTVAEALDDLGRQHDGILGQVLDSDREIRRFVNLYLGNTNVSALGGLAAGVEDKAVLSIVPAVAGGAG